MVRPLFAGSFDPPTLGHLDLIERGLSLFGQLSVAVGVNLSKTPLIPAEDRVALLRSCLGERPGLEILSFEGLVVDFARENGNDCLFRGLRSNKDFEPELHMALTNKVLAPELETVFLPASAAQLFTSSSLMKEILRFGGDLSSFLPEPVIEYLGKQA
ncbi:MAG TPA: pantetheine-phosphate adenylyltransferase [Planctomycetes bacterium]|nr:pantetheine-phosphate adenylyltransferase [Planctomycetota bacterium]